MSLQFSRSMRVLRLDSFRFARVGLALAAVNMVVLLLWFFLAKVSLYEVSTAISPGTEGRVNATFPEDAMRRIHNGQQAWLQLELEAEGESARYPAFVYDVPLDSDHVELVILSTDFPTDLPANRLKGRVEIEVERVRPATLILRSSNRLVSGSQAPAATQSEKGER